MWEKIATILFDTTCDFIKNKANAEKEKRQRLARVCLSVSNLLNEAANDLNNDEYPHGKCSSMHTLCDSMYEVLKDLTTKEKCDELMSIMRNASNLEVEFARRNDPDTAIQLQIAAGAFYSIYLINE